FYREINYSRPGEFFYYAAESAPGAPETKTANLHPAPARHHRSNLMYRFSKWTHNLMFTRASFFGKWGARVCRNSKNPDQGPRALRSMEHLSKAVLYQCKDCGDCSLPDIAFLCPESQCAKNQRNG